MAVAMVAPEVCVSSSFPRLHPALLLACVLVACAHGAPAPPPASPPAGPAAAATPAAPAPAPEARWLALALQGEPVGRSHEVIAGVAGGGFATRVASELR